MNKSAIWIPIILSTRGEKSWLLMRGERGDGAGEFVK